MFAQGTLPITEGLHETGSGISPGTDVPRLFHVNESNEVVERLVFKATIPHRDAFEDAKFLYLALL